MIVVDTSALIGVLVGRPQIDALVARIVGDPDLHAPHLIDVEILDALRRLVASTDLSQDRAEDARTDYADLVIARYPHQPLADRIWELRQTITAYDAPLVALAEALDCPLVTCDRRLGRAVGHRARIEVFQPEGRK